MTGPYGSPLDLSKCDLMRLAFEYRNTNQKEALDAIQAEIMKRQKAMDALIAVAHEKECKSKRNPYCRSNLILYPNGNHDNKK